MLSCKQVELIRIPLVQTLDVTTNDNQVFLRLNFLDFPSNSGATIGFIVIDSNQTYEVKTTIFETIQIDKLYEIKLDELQSSIGIDVQAFCDYNGKRYLGQKIINKQISLNPLLEILEFTRLNTNSVRLKLSVSKLGSFPLKEFKLVYSNKDVSNNLSFASINKDTVFDCILQNLKTGPTKSQSEYSFVLNLIRNNEQVHSSNELKLDFSTLKLTTDTFSIVSDSIFTLGGSITNLGNLPVVEYGFVWSSINPQPNYNDNKLVLKSLAQLGAFFADIKWKSNEANLFFRAYASDGEGVYYGKSMILEK